MQAQLILIGAPGSGKGTQADKLKGLSYEHLSTGDLLRNEVSQKSEIGLKVKKIMESGELVRDEIVFQILQKKCDLQKNKYIFDGLPRNIQQAKDLEEFVLKGTDCMAIYFNISLDLLKSRLINRRTCSDCGKIYNLLFTPSKKEGVCDYCNGTNLVQRKDDNEKTVEKRLSVFRETIDPVIDYYSERGILKKIDASKSAEEIFTEMRSFLL
jgi:adenylate kinase